MKRWMICLAALLLWLAPGVALGEGEDQLPDVGFEDGPAVTAAPAATKKPMNAPAAPVVQPTAAPVDQEPAGGLEGLEGISLPFVDFADMDPAPEAEATPAPTAPPTATFPPVEVAAVQGQRGLHPAWILAAILAAAACFMGGMALGMKRK